MARVARVVPDVAGIEAEFDYLIPDKWHDDVRIGTIVRVTLHNRRVRGWVVDADATPPEGVRLLELQKVTGYGPSQELIDLADWASWRWSGKRSFFLQTASPERVVSRIGDPVTPSYRQTDTLPVWFHAGVNAVHRLAPSRSPLDTVLEADRLGPCLLLTPSQRSAESWVRRLRAEGRAVALHPEDWAKAAAGGVTVVGTRAAVWSPMPELASIIVLDAHDEALQSERSPTWSAVEIATERARRRGVPCLLISPTPRVEQLEHRTLFTPDRSEERSGWAPLHVVDLRHTDPRTGLYSPALVELLRSDKRLVCVLNRKGRSQLLVCSHCDEIARCERCEGSQELHDEMLRCRRCDLEQPIVCRHCGASVFKQLRLGVSRIREDLESLALRPVGEVTGDSTELPDTHVLIGTEAVLHRVGKADAVAFLDFDQELLASRMRAQEDALVLLGRASRIVGGRDQGGIVIIQTRQPESAVVDAALRGDPARFIPEERERRRQMNWPPFVAMATVSGAAAEEYVTKLGDSVAVIGPMGDQWLVTAPDHQTLCDALAAVPRPSSGKLRVEVDPTRI